MKSLKPDKRTRRIHYDWLEAGEYTQRTVAQLSQQLRRFLDDQAWLENRRIMDLLHSIEGKTLKMREALFSPATQTFMVIEGFSADIELPMERPLYSIPIKPKISDIQLQAGDETLDSSVLYEQIVVDKARIAQHIRQSLQERSQISLQELSSQYPLQQGLAELLAYLELGDEGHAGHHFAMLVDEQTEDKIIWQTEEGIKRYAKTPRILFLHADATKP